MTFSEGAHTMQGEAVMSTIEHWLYTLYNFTPYAVHAYAFGSDEFISKKRTEILDQMVAEYEHRTNPNDRSKLPTPVMLVSKLSDGVPKVVQIYSSINPNNKIKNSKNYYCVFLPLIKTDNEALFDLH